MKRWFSLLLLMGALLGLMGQEAVFARAIPVKMMADQAVTAVQMSPDCAEMMGLEKQNPQPDMPCEGMTPDCIAKMGCAVPVALIPSALSDQAPEFRPSVPRQVPIAPLVGRETGPEPHPPARLGGTAAAPGEFTFAVRHLLVQPRTFNMKTLLSIAVALAALTSVSAASAHERGSGHWEWQSRPAPGPNKSNLPSRVRVWVNDAPAVANCDCAMMRDTAMAADCMAMPHKGGSSSHG